MRKFVLFLICSFYFNQLFAFPGVYHTQTRTPSKGVLVKQSDIIAGNTATTIAGTGSNTGSGFSWTSPGNITADDGTLATCCGNINTITTALTATNFGFSIPASATILGIVVNADKSTTCGGAADNAVTLRNSTGNIGTNTGTAWSGLQTYGSSTDLWSTSITVAEANASTFGFTVKAATNGNCNVFMDYISMTIYYSVFE